MTVATVAMATAAVVLSACGGTTAPRAGSTRRTNATSTSSPAPTSTTATTTSGPASTSASWLTYGGGFTRTSLDSTDPAFTRQPAAAWTSPALDGAVYGEALIDKGQVFVATENDTVYALSATDGAVAWSVHLGTPVPSGDLPCGDISPVVGVTSTMVIDPASGTIFASAEVLSGSSVTHVVDALDIATHRLLWSRDVDRPGWTGAAQLQRTGLALSAGHVIVAFGGNFGDCGNYHGWVVGVPESDRGPVLSYQVPTARARGDLGPGRRHRRRGGERLRRDRERQRRGGTTLRPRRQRHRVVTVARRAAVLRPLQLGPGQRR